MPDIESGLQSGGCSLVVSIVEKSIPVDWAKAWDEQFRKRGLLARLERAGISPETFWDAYGRFQASVANDSYPGKALLKILSLVAAGDCVVDVGAGDGAYSVPLARYVKSVIAIEPSSSQLNYLQKAVSQSGLNNIQIVPERWEEVGTSGLKPCDVVLASYSFQVPDIGEAINKMLTVTGKRLILVYYAGCDLVNLNRRLFNLQPQPDYRYLYNLLRQLGYEPGLEKVTRNFCVKLDNQLEMLGYNPGLTREQTNILKHELFKMGMVAKERDGYWLKRQQTDAIITVDVKKKDGCKENV